MSDSLFAAEPSALAGHDAEARARDPQDELRHGRLFFDRAPREIGEPGLSCDHRRASRPDALAGRGAVIVLLPPDGGPVALRLWSSPDAAAPTTAPDLAALERRARAEIGPGSWLVDAQVFWWCR